MNIKHGMTHTREHGIWLGIIQQASMAVVEESVKECKMSDSKCKQHSQPREVTSNDYDCSDIHIGYAEAMSDTLATAREITGVNNK